MAPEDPRKHGVKSTDPHIPGSIPDQGIDTLSHLICRFIGKCDRQDIRRVYRAHTDQIRDTVSDHARFAGTCPR